MRHIFKTGDCNKALIQTIKAILVIGVRYDWDSLALTTALYYQHFACVLVREPLKKWNIILMGARATSRSAESFKILLQEFAEEVIGEDAFNNQNKYIESTLMPTN